MNVEELALWEWVLSSLGGSNRVLKGLRRISDTVLLFLHCLASQLSLVIFHNGSLEVTLQYEVELDLSEIWLWGFVLNYLYLVQLRICTTFSPVKVPKNCLLFKCLLCAKYFSWYNGEQNCLLGKSERETLSLIVGSVRILFIFFLYGPLPDT